MNIVFLYGKVANIGGIYTTPKSSFVLNFTVATIRSLTTKSVIFHDCQIWNKYGQIFKNVAKKGDNIIILGHLSYYKHKKVKRSSIQVEQFILTNNKKVDEITTFNQNLNPFISLFDIEDEFKASLLQEDDDYEKE